MGQPCGRTGISRWSALHQAAYSGNAKAVFFLIDAGANSLATTGDGKTPIDVAKTGEVRKVLAENGSVSGQHVALAKGPKNTVPAKLVKVKGKIAGMKAGKKQIIKGKSAKKLVFKGKFVKTGGGLTKEQLTKSKKGKIVGKSAQAHGQQSYKYLKPWIEAFQKARAELQITGFVCLKKESYLYLKTLELYKQ